MLGLAKEKSIRHYQPIKDLRQGRHWVWGLTFRCAINEEIRAINTHTPTPHTHTTAKTTRNF